MGREQPTLKLSGGDKIGNHWLVKKKIDEGGCGQIWLVESVTNEKAHAAMKVEAIMKNKDDEILKMEVFVLKKMQKSSHFCRLFLAGKHSNFNFVVMSLLGRGLVETRHSMPRKRFTTSTSLRIGMQCLEGLKEMHTVGFIHRDIKPANFSFGSTESTKRQVFTFDFGLARQILLPVQGKNELRLREPRKKVAFRGTVRYCSINVHHNREQGRHDDIMSLMYVMIEMITGNLPWSGNHRKESGEVKEAASDQYLFKHCPMNFATVFSHLKGCAYKDIPDYALIEESLKSTLVKKKVTDASPFDWEKGGHYYDHHKHVSRSRKPIKKQADEKLEKDDEDSSPSTDVVLSTDESESGAGGSSTSSDYTRSVEQEDTLENVEDL